MSETVGKRVAREWAREMAYVGNFLGIELDRLAAMVDAAVSEALAERDERDAQLAAMVDAAMDGIRAERDEARRGRDGLKLALASAREHLVRLAERRDAERRLAEQEDGRHD